MDGWNTIFLLGRPIFLGYVSFSEGSVWPTNNDDFLSPKRLPWQIYANVENNTKKLVGQFKGKSLIRRVVSKVRHRKSEKKRNKGKFSFCDILVLQIPLAPDKPTSKTTQKKGLFIRVTSQIRKIVTSIQVLYKFYMLHPNNPFGSTYTPWH